MSARHRTRKLRDPVPVEVNYDPEAEKLPQNQDVRDIRYVRVRVPDGKLVPEAGRVQLLAAEKLPAEACPVAFHSAPVFPGQGEDGVVEFKLHLNDTALARHFGGSIEQAALGSTAQPLPFRLVVGLRKEKETDPDDLERPGALTINLNRLKWEWQALTFGAKGEPQRAGDVVANDPIEVKMDGSDQNGFRLRLTLEKRQANGQYSSVEADFTHYLAPAERRIDDQVLAPVPKPATLTGDQRQIETTWRTVALPKDAPLLQKLPVETTLRVRAYPAGSIRRHRDNEAPITEPANAAAVAVREIPLRLGLRQWKVRVVTPELAADVPPLLLAGARPWEEGFEVEVEIFDDSGSPVEPLRHAKVLWKMRPGPNGEMAGRMLGSGEAAEHGEWQTDAAGRVRFRYAPTRDNALLLANPRQSPVCGAEFELALPDAEGQPGKPLPAHDAAGDASKPSFHFHWAPKFDVALFKLPFFIDPAVTLDLEPEPDEETAPALQLQLGPQEKDYRELFRTGGTLKLVFKVTDPGGDPVQAFEADLEHVRLVLGGTSLVSGERRQIARLEDLGALVDLKSLRVSLSAPPSGGGGGGDLTLAPEIRLHPEVRRVLQSVAEACAELDPMLSACSQLPAARFATDGLSSFRSLAGRAFHDAAGFLCATEQATLCTKRREIRATLGAQVSFLQATGETWKRLGRSIDVHRSAFKRLESAMLNFYYDFILWDKVAKPLAAGWEKLRGRFPWLPADLRLNMPIDYLHKLVQTAVVKSGIDALAKPALAKCLQKLRDARDRRFRNLGYDLERLGEVRAAAQRGLQAAEQRLESSVGQVERSLDDLGALNTRIETALQEAREKGLSGQALDQAVAPLLAEHERLRAGVSRQIGETTEAMAAFERQSAARAVTECEHRAAEAERRIVDSAEQKLTEGGQKLEAALSEDELNPARLQEIMDEARKAPVTELAREARDGGLAFVQEFAASRESYAARLNSRLATLGGRGSAAILAPLPAGGPLGQRAVDPAELQQQILGLEGELQRRLEGTRQTLAEAGRTYPARVNAAEVFHRAISATSDELVSDAVKSGSHAPLEVLRTTLEEKAPVPPDTGQGYVTAFVDFLVYCVRSVVNALVGAAKMLLGQLYRLFSLLLRGVLFLLGLLFRLTARFGAKITEALTILLQSTMGARGAVWPTTALTPTALEAGMAELRQAHASADEFFGFPYFRETNFLDQMQTAATNFGQSKLAADRATEEAVEEALKTGYEDYYPSQLTQSRALLFGLCQRALAAETLQRAPCPDAERAGRRSVACLLAGDQLGQQIDGLMRAALAAESTGKGFFVPLVDLVGRTEWNAASLESIADWCGWIIGWTFRVGALVLAIAAWWFPPALVISGSMVAAAATVSAVSGAFRLSFAACGYYPYSTAYPRDLVALQGAHYAAVFRDESERLSAEEPANFVRDYPK
ncbi:MAG: hypothetical protein JSR82_12345 [Verrucomicrobia bacterium]|nr:hypothetical protein [Verrucomicrobiota bacterium]